MLHLTAEEEAWLAGDAGPAVKRAMEIVVALATIYGAERLVPVESVQISGVSYRNIGDAGLDFLRRWADEGARVRVPTTLNPTAMDMIDWAAQGFSVDFAEKQAAVVEVFARMGVGGGHPVPTCTPYLIGNRPPVGAHVAWAESSAVAFANSVLGARTNREGGPGAIAAALTGRTGDYGLHLDAARVPTLRVEVTAPFEAISDYSALGAIVGQRASKGVPIFVGLPLTRADDSGRDPLWEEKLKALGAAMAATGAVALFHVAGVTPEASGMGNGEWRIGNPESRMESRESRIQNRGSSGEDPGGGQAPVRLDTLVVDDLAPGYAALSDPVTEIDLVWIGCPHASLQELALVAERVRGMTLRVPLWVTCARPVRSLAVEQGLVDIIEAAGGRVFADACMAIAPVRDLGFSAVATPSAKGATYLRNLARVAARFGTLDACVEAALTGRWQKGSTEAVK
jgi:predicted aconitase